MPEQLGLIGLGLMGKPMTRNLLKAGYQVTVFNRSRPAIDELAAHGAIPARSAREVAECSTVLITMLPDAPDVEAVIFGDNGALEGAHAGLLLIDMSTTSPLAARRIAAALQRHALHFLDAPVSGGDAGAREARLSIMVGGQEADFERALPIFAALGQRITYCGPAGSGQVVKACNQIVVALVIEAISEALALGSSAGVDPALVLKALGGGLAQSRVLELRGPTMIEHNFAPGGKAKFHHKDLGFALQLAREHGVALPMTALVDQLFAVLVDKGMGDLDHSALLAVLEMLSQRSPVDDSS